MLTNPRLYFLVLCLAYSFLCILGCMESEDDKTVAKNGGKAEAVSEKTADRNLTGSNKAGSKFFKQPDVRQEMSYQVSVLSSKPEYVAFRLDKIFKSLEIENHGKISLTEPIGVEVPAKKYLQFLRLLQDLKTIKVDRKEIERKITEPNTIMFSITIKHK